VLGALVGRRAEPDEARHREPEQHDPGDRGARRTRQRDPSARGERPEECTQSLAGAHRDIGCHELVRTARERRHPRRLERSHERPRRLGEGSQDDDHGERPAERHDDRGHYGW
jgi:hypothetical protein